MPRKIRAKLILQLASQGLSQNAISRGHHISKRSVNEVLSLAAEAGITFEDVKGLPNDEVYRRLYPGKFAAEALYQEPDYAYVHDELKRVGVTLKLLWQEHQQACQSAGKLACGYTKFCFGYEAYVAESGLTNHLEHKPGEACEVDWSGVRVLRRRPAPHHLRQSEDGRRYASAHGRGRAQQCV